MVKAKIIPKDIAIKIVCIMAKRKSKYTEKIKILKEKLHFSLFPCFHHPKRACNISIVLGKDFFCKRMKLKILKAC